MRWNRPTQLHLAPRWKKRPTQARSRHLVAAVIDACLLIAEREGPAALTTNHIAEVAGVGIASLYQYFPNRDAILSATYDAILDQERAVLTNMDETLSGSDGRLAVDRLIRRGIAMPRRLVALSPDFYRKYHREFQLATRLDAGNPQAAIHQAMASAGMMFSRFGSDLRVANNPVIQFIFTRGVGAMIDRAAEEEPALLDDPEFREALTDMVVNFLLKRGDASA